MIAVGIAKQVGDLFTHSLYDIHIALSGVPMLTLDEVLPDRASLGRLNAKSIMQTKVVSLPEAMSYDKIDLLLRSTSHSSFPLTTNDHAGGRRLFHGLISRSKLADILLVEQEKEELRKRAAASGEDTCPMTRSPDRTANPPEVQNGLAHVQTVDQSVLISVHGNRVHSESLPRSTSSPALNGHEARAQASSIEFAPASADAKVPRGANDQSRRSDPLASGKLKGPTKRPSGSDEHSVHRPHCSASAAGLVDLRPHCDRSPYVINELLPLRRVFRLFQTMGLRSLVVVDAHSCVVGMITRKDFLKITRKTMLSRAVHQRREDSLHRYMKEGADELQRSRQSRKAPSASPVIAAENSEGRVSPIQMRMARALSWKSSSNDALPQVVAENRVEPERPRSFSKKRTVSITVG